MSALDRWIQFGLAAGISVLLFLKAFDGYLPVILGLVAFVLFVSAFTGFSPLYLPFRINTARRR